MSALYRDMQYCRLPWDVPDYRLLYKRQSMPYGGNLFANGVLFWDLHSYLSGYCDWYCCNTKFEWTVDVDSDVVGSGSVGDVWVGVRSVREWVQVCEFQGEGLQAWRFGTLRAGSGEEKASILSWSVF